MCWKRVKVPKYKDIATILNLSKEALSQNVQSVQTFGFYDR